MLILPEGSHEENYPTMRLKRAARAMPAPILRTPVRDRGSHFYLNRAVFGLYSMRRRTRRANPNPIN
jgi:hypothetical protein